MVKYVLTKKAVSDLGDIWNYTLHKWSEEQADKYYIQIKEVCQEISENPSLGRKYDEIEQNLFGYRANKHIIFYRVLPNKPIEITRILHGRMDLKNRMK